MSKPTQKPSAKPKTESALPPVQNLLFDLDALPSAPVPSDPSDLSDPSDPTDRPVTIASSTPKPPAPPPTEHFVRPGDRGPLSRLMDGNFLQFASYTICHRAIPTVEDGLKPVQRRILHSLYEKDDGRFIKVASVVGHAMQYHPHGDV